MGDPLPTPARVMEAYSQAGLEISRELGITIPVVMIRERVCEILYRETQKETDE